MTSPPDHTSPLPKRLIDPDNPETTLTLYSPWKLHARIIFSCSTSTYTTIISQHHPRSTPYYSWQRYHTSRIPLPPSTQQTPSDTTLVTLFVERLLTRNVAVLLDCANPTPARWVAKFYASHWPVSSHLEAETTAYEKCHTLQGTEIPFYYGAWGIAGVPDTVCRAVLTELVVPGVTVGELCERVRSMEEGWHKREARYRLAELHSSATRAVDRVNSCGIGHCMLDGEHMILGGVVGEECVVLVGFGWANAFEDPKKGYEWWLGLHLAFMVEGGSLG